RFDEAIGFFARPRYQIMATGEDYDGSDALGGLMQENVTAFPDFRYDFDRIHHADEAIVVEGTFRGTQEGTWRGLPATGRRVEFLAGLEGAEAFYDPDNIGRSDAHPFVMVDMFGVTNIEMYDGARHFALKSIALQAFGTAALTGYLPDMQRLIGSTLSRLAAGGEFVATAEFRRLAIESICWNILGLPPGPDTETMTLDHATLLAGLAPS